MKRIIKKSICNLVKWEQVEYEGEVYTVLSFNEKFLFLQKMGEVLPKTITLPISMLEIEEIKDENS